MKTSKYVILGGGMVAGYAAKQMAEGGLKAGELTIVSADTALPYERPPLSKGFLSGKDTEESIRINPEEFYGKHGIQVRLGCDITGLDIQRRILRAKSGEEFGFEKLVIATGARARTFDVPGGSLSGIFYLRSIEDSKRIRDSAKNARGAVVIGGGFIGMEVASILNQKGAAVTLVMREDRIWEQLFTPAMSQFFEKYYSDRGVRFVKQTNVSGFRGAAGGVDSVVLEKGPSLKCDLVVAGIGVLPVTELVANSGIEIGDGVVVNEYLEANQHDIYAAGDVANYPDRLFGKRRRVEHWDNAVSQGQHCARALLGERAPFVHVPYFFSDVFDLSYEFWGDPSGADEIAERGDLSSNSFSVWWIREQRLIAAFAMNRPGEEREAAPNWIESKQRLSRDKLKGDRPLQDSVR